MRKGTILRSFGVSTLALLIIAIVAINVLTVLPESAHAGHITWFSLSQYVRGVVNRLRSDVNSIRNPSTGGISSSKPGNINGLNLSGNSIDLIGGGAVDNPPRINFNQGGSSIFDNTDLHIVTDDKLYLNAFQIITPAQLIFGTGTGSSLYDDSNLHMATDDDLYLDASNEVKVQNNLRVGGTLQVASGDALIGNGIFNNPSSNADLYVTGNLEIDGTIYGSLAGTINPGLTAGSVLFQGALGMAQDNNNFFWDDAADRLGLGINTPATNLHVYNGNNATSVVRIESNRNEAGGHAGRIELLAPNSPVSADKKNFQIANINSPSGADYNALVFRQINDALLTNAGLLALTHGGGTAGSILMGDYAHDPSTPGPTNGLAVSGRIGIGTRSPSTVLQVVGGSTVDSGIQIQNTLTDATSKEGRIKVGHYTNAEEPVTGMIMQPGLTNNQIFFGGGSAFENAATLLQFYTATNTTTTTGSERMRIDSNGLVGIGATSLAYKLEVRGTANDVTSGSIRATNPTDGTSAAGLISVVSGTTNAASGFFGAFSSSYTANALHADRISVATNSDASGINIYAGTSGQDIRMYTGGSNERIRVDSTGNVGIGATTSLNKLTVDIGSSAAVDSGITIQGTTATKGDMGLRLKNTGTGGIEWYIDSTNNGSDYGGGKLAFAPGIGPVPVMTLSNTSVGIGSTSPTATLEVKSSATNEQVNIRNNTQYIYMGANSSDYVNMGGFKTGTGAIPLALQTAGGNVGVGTTGPATRLEVRDGTAGYWGQTTAGTWGTGSTTTPPQALTITNSANGGYDPVLLFRQTTSIGTLKTSGAIDMLGTGAWTDGTVSSQISDMLFILRDNADTLQERMRVTSGGNVGIGTTTTTNARLNVATSGSIYGILSEYSGSQYAYHANITTASPNGGYRATFNSGNSGMRGFYATVPNGATAIAAFRADMSSTTDNDSNQALILNDSPVSAVTRNGALGQLIQNSNVTGTLLDLTAGKTTNIALSVTTGTVGIGGTPSGTTKVQITGGDLNLGAGTFNNASGSEDLYVTGNAEIDGTIFGSVSGAINPGLTQGSVLFQGASGIAQDNTNFFWDDSNNRLGIGVNSSLLANIHVSAAPTDESGTYRGIFQSATAAPAAISSASFRGGTFNMIMGGTSDYSGTQYGLNVIAGHTGTGAQTGTLNGVYSSVQVSGGNTVANAIAGNFAVSTVTSPATITTAVAGQFQLTNSISGSTVGTGHGIRVLTPTITGVSTIGTNYGIRINNQGVSGVTTAIGLQVDAQSGAGTNYAAIFAGGNVGVGATTPTAPLHVKSTSGTIALIEATGGNSAMALIGTTTATLQLNGAAGNVRDIVYQTSGSGRWVVRADDSTESGSNVGSDFLIQSRTDAGGFLSTVLLAKRETGYIGLGTGSNINSRLTLVAATDAAGGILFGTDTNLYRSAADTLKTDDSLVVVANFTLDGKLITTPSAVQTLTAVGNAITANATAVQVKGNAAYTLTSTPTIADGSNGQQLYIIGNDNTNTITVQDEGTLAGSNIELATGVTTRTLGNGDTLHLIFSTAKAAWIEIAYTNVD